MKKLSLLIIIILSINIANALPEDFVYLRDVDPSILQEIRYASAHNFIGRPAQGYEANECILTSNAANALARIQKELQSYAYTLKVYDCYRPERAVKDFLNWSAQLNQQKMKQEFYPRVNKSDVFQLGYLAAKSGHSRGSTIDLTIVKQPVQTQEEFSPRQPLQACTAEYSKRFRDNSIDMGSGFDCLDKVADISNRDVNQTALSNRWFLRQLMQKNNFIPYDKEWWHFTLKNEPHPNTYYDFPITQVVAENKNLNILVLSDIHFDPFTTCTKSPCLLIEKLRQAPGNQWSAILAAEDKQAPQYRQDTNYPLLVSSLNEAKKIAETKHARLVIILGDFLGHKYKTKYKRFSTDKKLHEYESFVAKTFSFIDSQLGKTFPDLDVYFVTGNNDTYQRNYLSEPNGRFFRDTAQTWSNLLKNKNNRIRLLNQFNRAGYYSVIAAENLRLIFLNTTLFSPFAKGHEIPRAANNELNWLHDELQAAKQNHEKVIIAMHIPEGVDVYATLRIKLFTIVQLWKQAYVDRFQQDLKKYAPEIVAVLAGHLHSDWLQMLTFDNREIPIVGVSSISPIFGNNPGFKLLTYGIEDQQLVDYMTYYYPLNGVKNWAMEYGFNRLHIN